MTGFKFIHHYHRDHQKNDNGGRFCIAYALSDDHRTCCLSWAICHPDDSYNKDIGRKLAKENFKPGNPRYFEISFEQLYTIIETLNKYKFDSKVQLTIPDRYLLHNAQFLTHFKLNDSETINNFKLTMIKKQTFNKILIALVYMQDPVLIKKFVFGNIGHCCCD